MYCCSQLISCVTLSFCRLRIQSLVLIFTPRKVSDCVGPTSLLKAIEKPSERRTEIVVDTASMQSVWVGEIIKMSSRYITLVTPSFRNIHWTASDSLWKYSTDNLAPNGSRVSRSNVGEDCPWKGHCRPTRGQWSLCVLTLRYALFISTLARKYLGFISFVAVLTDWYFIDEFIFAKSFAAFPSALLQSWMMRTMPSPGEGRGPLVEIWVGVPRSMFQTGPEMI